MIERGGVTWACGWRLTAWRRAWLVLVGLIAGCGGGAGEAAYDRAAFCATWADLAEGSDVAAEQAVAAARRLPSLGPPAISSELQTWADYFEEVIPLVNELSRGDPAPTSARRTQLEQQIEAMTERIRPVMARIGPVVESECPGGVSSDRGESASSPPTSSAIGAELAAVVECRRDHGVEVAMPSGVGNRRVGASQPFDPLLATTAWRACRALYVPLARDVPGASGVEQLAMLDCMATKGWIQAFMGPVADVAALEADSAACAAAPTG